METSNMESTPKAKKQVEHTSAPARVKTKTERYTLIALCVGLLVYGVFFPSDIRTNTKDFLKIYLFLYLAQSYLIVSILILIFYFFCFAQKRGLLFFGLAFFTIHVSLVAGKYIGTTYQQHAEARKYKVNSITTQKLPNANISGSGRINRPSIKPTASAAETSKQFEIIVRFIDSTTDRDISLMNNYDQEMSALELELLLDPEWINNDREFAESKKRIQEAKSIVKKYHALVDIEINQNRIMLEELQIDDAYKNIALSNYDNKYLNEHVGKWWEYEYKVMVEFEKLIIFLSENNGEWEISKDQIMFSTVEDENTYYSLITSLESLGMTQDNIQKQQLYQVNNAVKKMLENENSDTSNNTSSIERTLNSNRHYEEKGGFSYVPPNGWRLRDFKGMKFKQILGDPIDGYTPNIIILDEISSLSLSEYIIFGYINSKEVFTEMEMVSCEPFETAEGLNGYKTISHLTHNAIALRIIAYSFSKGKNKYSIFCYRLQSDTERGIDTIFNNVLLTFRFE